MRGRRVLLALVLGGCLAYEARPSTGAADAAPDLAAQACEGRSDYPVGPYGKAEGAVLEDLTLKSGDGAPFRLSSLHQDCGRRLLLVSTSAGWCTACIEEQPKLQALHEQYAAAGLVVMVAFFEDANFEPAKLRNVQDWKERYGLDFPVLLDEAFVFGDYYDRESTPMTMLVELETMTILRIMNGFDESTVRSLITQKLE
ncbi:MAG: TlpA family protein disulfide reductase [Myxococcales bacterium]|nr:TlpA family protein disulfide reductase [Myxococcales bacterium]